MTQPVTLDRASDRDPPKKPTFHTGLHSVPSRRSLRANAVVRSGKRAMGPDWIIDDLRELPATAVINRIFRLPL